MTEKQQAIREVLTECWEQNKKHFKELGCRLDDILILDSPEKLAASLMWDKCHDKRIAKLKGLPELRKEGIETIKNMKKTGLPDSELHDALLVHWINYFKRHKEKDKNGK